MEVENRQCSRDSCGTSLANPTIVYTTHGVASGHTISDTETEETPLSTNQGCGSSIEKQSSFDGMSCVRQQSTINILMSSWKSGTKKQYTTFIKRWFQYSSQRKVSPVL